MKPNQDIEYHFDQVLKEENRESFRVIFNYFYPILCNYSMRYLTDAEVGKDLVSDLFFTIWYSRKNIVIKSSCRAYLFAALRNRILNYLRDKDTHVELSENCPIQSTAAKPDELMEYQETHQYVNLAIKLLPNRCREIFALSRYEGKAYKEIAQDLNISEKAVEAHVSRALKFLRTHMSL